MSRAYFIVALAACAACTTDATRQTNFERCIANDRACDASLLTSAEEQRLFELHRQRHFQDCLGRMRCNESALSEQELRAVHSAVAELNLDSCLKGEASCRLPALTDLQRAQVDEAVRARNFELCAGGLTGCDESALTPSQRAAARAAYLERNFSGCMNTVGTLVRCNPDDLSKEQRERVRLRNLSANLYVCSRGIPGCDERMLEPEQRATIGDR